MNGRVPERIHVYRNHHLDSTRWDGFVPRDDDIVVTTAYKAGTTWTLRILAAFVFGPGPLQVPVRDFAPWIDARIVFTWSLAVSRFVTGGASRDTVASASAEASATTLERRTS